MVEDKFSSDVKITNRFWFCVFYEAVSHFAIL